jgi:hypothetical protein
MYRDLLGVLGAVELGCGNHVLESSLGFSPLARL